MTYFKTIFQAENLQLEYYFMYSLRISGENLLACLGFPIINTIIKPINTSTKFVALMKALAGPPFKQMGIVFLKIFSEWVSKIYLL